MAIRRETSGRRRWGIKGSSSSLCVCHPFLIPPHLSPTSIMIPLIKKTINMLDPNTVDSITRRTPSAKPVVEKDFCTCTSTYEPTETTSLLEQGHTSDNCPKYASACDLRTFLRQDPRPLDVDYISAKSQENPYNRNDGWFGPFPVTYFSTNLERPVRAPGWSKEDATGTRQSESQGSATTSSGQSGFDALPNLESGNSFANDTFPTSHPPQTLYINWYSPDRPNFPPGECTCSEGVIDLGRHTGAPFLNPDGSDSGRCRSVGGRGDIFKLDEFNCHVVNDSEFSEGSTLHLVRIDKGTLFNDTAQPNDRFSNLLKLGRAPDEAKIALSGERDDDGALQGMVWVRP